MRDSSVVSIAKVNEKAIPFGTGLDTDLQDFATSPEVARLPFATAEPLLCSLSFDELEELYQRAEARDPGFQRPNLERYYREVTFRNDEELEAAAQLLEELYPVGRYGEFPVRAAPVIASCVPPRERFMIPPHLLGNNTIGKFRVALIERGWEINGVGRHPGLEHLELETSGVPRFGEEGEHGVAALGVLAGIRASSPFGIYPNPAKVVIAAIDRAKTCTNNIADAICWSLTKLSAGDVILVEVQKETAGCVVPVEVEHAIANAISLATALGITVIEPAANGRMRLDAQLNLPGLRQPFLSDSGAIVIGAGMFINGKWHRDDCTNYGPRIDCFGPGDPTHTFGNYPVADPDGFTDPEQMMTCGFSNTSAAAALIAGIALIVQDAAQRRFGAPFHPKVLRHLLRDPRNGVECAPREEVGVMPQFEKLAANIFD